MVVDLPAPFGPSRATVSPGAMSMSTPRTAWTGPAGLRNVLTRPCMATPGRRGVRSMSRCQLAAGEWPDGSAGSQFLTVTDVRMAGVMDRCAVFHELHVEGFFVMPNPWDVGSAVRLQKMGFPALATTSSGFAWSIGKEDQQVTRDELLGHVEALVAATEVPLNVDAERCYADDPAGVARHRLAHRRHGRGGLLDRGLRPGQLVSIEPLDVATERVAAAASAKAGMVLTARAEQHLYGPADLDDTIRRLCAYRDAGADVLYAPGLVDLDQIEAVVRAVERPINVLKLPAVPNLAALAGVGVRRVSTGGGLARTAYSAMRHAAAALLEELPG